MSCLEPCPGTRPASLIGERAKKPSRPFCVARTTRQWPIASLLKPARSHVPDAMEKTTPVSLFITPEPTDPNRSVFLQNGITAFAFSFRPRAIVYDARRAGRRKAGFGLALSSEAGASRPGPASSLRISSRSLAAWEFQVARGLDHAVFWSARRTSGSSPMRWRSPPAPVSTSIWSPRS